MHAAKRYIYAWGAGTAEGNGAMKDLLGGKGAGLAEMTLAGLPTPPGFTITTAACNDYFSAGKQLPDGLWADVLEAMKQVEERSGKGFGDAANPLLVSVRSGAKFSMPGMMDTVLNLGLNEQTLEGLIALSGNERFGWDAYRRFIGMFGCIVMDVKAERFDGPLEAMKERVGAQRDYDLGVAELREIAGAYLRAVREDTGREFPTDPLEQLRLAVEAVFASWFGKRATDYRTSQRIPHDLGTAANIVTMVFGNLGDDCATGVAFTRNTFDGTNELYGEYLVNAQGEDVVLGLRTPQPISAMRSQFPSAYAEFVRVGRQLERHYRDVQDLEFTVERGKLYMLQTRIAKRTAGAAVKIAVQLVDEGLITKKEAVERIAPAQVDGLLRPQLDPRARATAVRIARGIDASPGAAIGCAAFSAEAAVAMAGAGEPVVLVRVEANPDDFPGLVAAAGVLTSRGGQTSAAAVVARQIGKPCVAGASLVIDHVGRVARAQDGGPGFAEGDWITIDGSTGNVYAGRLPTWSPVPEDRPELLTILRWADEIRRMHVWANADTPEQAAFAQSWGAQGIGLCRTEHMFLMDDRLAITQEAILHARVASAAKSKVAWGGAVTPAELAEVAAFDAAIARLEPLQRADFEGMFRAMDGLPVVIRLMDPPLHEFLPNLEEQLVKVTLDDTRGGASAEDRLLLTTIRSMHEQNPMLGLRGCRLIITMPEFAKMQVRAIVGAMVAVRRLGGHPIGRILVPHVGFVNELRVALPILAAEAADVDGAATVSGDYTFGAMIEVPRAALTADEIATQVPFFSFGTNDLTQMTLGLSRDDAEAGLLETYRAAGVLLVNPFQTLDDAVAGLMKIAVDKGRSVRPELELGICGEHGGDPDSIHKSEAIGLDYVSCSPYRVPVARLAAAQAVLAAGGR